VNLPREELPARCDLAAVAGLADLTTHFLPSGGFSTVGIETPEGTVGIHRIEHDAH